MSTKVKCSRLKMDELENVYVMTLYDKDEEIIGRYYNIAGYFKIETK